MTVTAYGRPQVRHVAEVTCRWYGSWHTRATTQPTSTTAAPASRGTGPRPKPAFEDMLIKLRRTLIAARFSGSRPAQPTGEQIHAVLSAWDAAAA
ncbi:MAG: hypothetical protein ACLQDY_13500 [Streptosporangiaceae bacterium]